jgi:lipid II:glycine glycyltransferase (peptidoglycan interpeptide bridge formation enzyme)
MLKKLTAEQFDKFSVTYPLTSFYQSSSWGRLKTFNGVELSVLWLGREQ